MSHTPPSAAALPLSRRQFGLVVGGGALLLLGGATYGVVSRSTPGGGSGLATAFGALSIVDAGRLARLDAQGHPAARPLASAISQVKDGLHTAAAGRQGIRQASSRQPSSAGHDPGHDSDPLLDSDWPQPGNFTWGDVVVLEVALRNDQPEPVLFSPGQLRLRLLPSGITVAPQDSDHGPGTIAAGATERVWISYLAPHDAVTMQIEYSGLDDDASQLLALPQLTVTGVRS
ncbi:hypothetical protein SAMN04489743_0704 [Pseudarthrobacter equi]|uniref:Uncharacterized protein n=1 Tax=Pseudarthrobacter equi TaxID=728066 RepID=A0A1H1UJP4_9MICC|nr:hypothetical protein [Pseudarthrobacter equi]SDS72531.1 hypothetical protein SAMN04489743_0704 [Pseudarthrobacter equi]